MSWKDFGEWRSGTLFSQSCTNQTHLHGRTQVKGSIRTQVGSGWTLISPERERCPLRTYPAPQALRGLKSGQERQLRSMDAPGSLMNAQHLLDQVAPSYEADTKTLSCWCRLFLLFSQDLRSPIGQQWYQVIGKQKQSMRMSGRQEHDQERVLVSASYPGSPRFTQGRTPLNTGLRPHHTRLQKTKPKKMNWIESGTNMLIW